MHVSSPLRVSLAAAVAALAAGAVALEPREFVAGWPIDAPAGAEVFDLPLPAEVYAAGTIEQLAVLDANGEPQPFFRRGPEPRAERRVVVEASPLYAAQLQQGLVVGVTSGDRGTSVNVASDAPATATARSTVVGFVLDARGPNIAPVALELDWRALPQPFLLDVVVEQSTDLTSWRTVGRASVAALSVDGAEARHARVPVRAAAGGYLRVTTNGAVADWYLLRATLVSSAAETATPISLRVAPLPDHARPNDAALGTLYFDAGGPLPVATATLAFGDDDGWARADIAAAHSLDGPWIPIAYGELMYRLSFEGREFSNEPIKVARYEARYWRVVPAAPPRGEHLELALEFPQETLRIAVGGRAPYLLAAGTLSEEAGPDATLASVWATLDRPAEVPLAALGARRELGGADALVAASSFPWRLGLLWTVLIVGVLVVGTMAVRLAREMRNPTS
ncbi:MAG TPA: DUF3999 family protein [Gammaproteobacteria bacterium]